MEAMRGLRGLVSEGFVQLASRVLSGIDIYPYSHGKAHQYHYSLEF